MSAIVPVAQVVAVDDDPTTRSILEKLLPKHGIAVALCANGAEMWAQFARAVPKLVILDVEMPGDDGFLLAEEVRARHGMGVVILMLTSHGLPGDLAVAMEAGADDFLTKPCDWNRLVSLVRRYLAPGPLQIV